MIEHVISHLISRKVENRVDRWVGAGRNSLPILEGDTFTLRFGARYRIQTIVCAVTFIAFTSLAAWCHFFSEPLGFWLGFACVACRFDGLAILLHGCYTGKQCHEKRTHAKLT